MNHLNISSQTFRPVAKDLPAAPFMLWSMWSDIDGLVHTDVGQKVCQDGSLLKVCELLQLACNIMQAKRTSYASG